MYIVTFLHYFFCVFVFTLAHFNFLLAAKRTCVVCLLENIDQLPLIYKHNYNRI